MVALCIFNTHTSAFLIIHQCHLHFFSLFSCVSFQNISILIIISLSTLNFSLAISILLFPLDTVQFSSQVLEFGGLYCSVAAVLGTKPRTSCRLCRCCTAELHYLPRQYIFYLFKLILVLLFSASLFILLMLFSTFFNMQNVIMIDVLRLLCILSSLLFLSLFFVFSHH